MQGSLAVLALRPQASELTFFLLHQIEVFVENLGRVIAAMVAQGLFVVFERGAATHASFFDFSEADYTALNVLRRRQWDCARVLSLH